MKIFKLPPMNPSVQSSLSKLKFALGLNPKVESTDNIGRFIPEPYKAVILIQADFELAWAWRFAHSLSDPLPESEKIGLLERENIPKILQLCDKYNIPVTWATVGHLFLENCSRGGTGFAHPEIKRLPHFENKFWKYIEKDWFEMDPCSDFNEAPAWYCPDLIKLIMQSKTKHEIGCHTFSHIDCSDEICQPDVLESELELCCDLANKKGIDLHTFVHPAHTIGNLKTLVKFGYTNYRTNYGKLLAYPVFHSEGIWELKSTSDFTWRSQWSARYHGYRYCKIIERAIKNRSVCVFWFHPSMDSKFIQHVMPVIFEFLENNKNIVKVFTSGEYVDFLNKSSFRNT
jgi:peptidoglycan/xylan/chitin deacetylase (PgdA/CDA1 family)